MEFKVSVIIPVYNAAEFVRTAVESANNLEETAEIILIEDGSPDQSIAICKQLEKEYSKVRFYQHPDKKNHGVSVSRNLGIANAKYEFVAFLDADDYYLPNRFLKDKEILLSEPLIDGVYNALGIHYYTENGKRIFFEAGYKYQEFYTLSADVPPEELFFVLFNMHPTCKGEFHGDTITVRMSIFDKVGVFPTNLKLQEDTHLWRRMAAKCKLAAGNISEAVATRGVHDHNTMVNPGIQLNAQEIWFNNLYRWLKKEKIRKDYIECFELSFLYFKIKKHQKVTAAFQFLYFFLIKHPKYIKVKFGSFDTYFWDLFGRNWITLHLISLKNKILNK
jgi:glycosyltransferase involved in cell wall biosynthesis